jgi:dTMP kinase
LLLDPHSEIVAEAECLLFLASRAEVVRRVLEPALDNGKVILLDRFFLSTYAYQIGGRGLPAAEVAAANALATGGLVPNITLLLSIDPDAGLERVSQRGAHDRMELTGREFHARVSRAFQTFGTREWQREHPECGEVVVVDASGSEDVVFNAILTELRKRWPQRFGAE